MDDVAPEDPELEGIEGRVAELVRPREELLLDHEPQRPEPERLCAHRLHRPELEVLCACALLHAAHACTWWWSEGSCSRRPAPAGVPGMCSACLPWVLVCVCFSLGLRVLSFGIHPALCSCRKIATFCWRTVSIGARRLLAQALLRRRLAPQRRRKRPAERTHRWVGQSQCQ